MEESIMQDEKECFITHSTYGLQKHHIYGGPFRTKSDKYGCWIWLRHDWHTGTSYAVHSNRKLMLLLRKECQKEFEKKYSHEFFMKLFKKDYLEVQK